MKTDSVDLGSSFLTGPKSEALSPTMQKAVEYAQAHGGSLVRFPGGFWRRGDSTQWDAQGESFGTPTVEAIVARGVGEYTEWKDNGRNGCFPIRMTLRARQ